MQSSPQVERFGFRLPGHRRARGFSLIELIGVLAILTIVAASLTPAVLRQMDEAARTKEVADLQAITNALVQQILSTNGSKTIPSETTWAQAVAQRTRQPVGRILTNNRGCPRAFLIDTNGWFGTAAGALPYAQNTTGSLTAPVNARLLIVSTIARPFLPVTSGKPGTAAFNDIWNTPRGAKPSTWTTWQGKGEDLVIQRLTLDPLFHRLILVNRDTLGTAPTFSIDTTNVLDVPLGGAGRSAFYLDGTMVGLCNSSGTPMRRFQLTRDYSFIYEGSVWYDKISGGDSIEVMAHDFADVSAKFLASQWYPGANQPGRGDQQGALIAMFNFMLVYSLWADQYPHFPRHGANEQQVPEYQLLNELVGPSSGGSSSDLLDLFTGANGLLNK